MPNTNDSHGESKIIFENDDWLIVEPFDYDSYVYNAPEGMKSKFGEFREGNVYFIVDKNNNATYAGGFKTYMIYKYNDDIEYYWWNGKEIKTRVRFIEDFPEEIIEVINPLIGAGKLYNLLTKLMNREEVNLRELEAADETIYDFKYAPKAPYKSKITFGFDDEEYIKLFDPSDDDLWYYNAIVNSYDGYDFESEDQAIDDFQQGYIEHFFNGENRVKLKEILSIILPDCAELETDEQRENAGKKLYDMFERDIDNIISDYVSEMNNCKSRQFEKEIKDNLCDAFYDDFILTEDCMSRYFTSVELLYDLYNTIGDTTLTIKELLFKIGSEMNLTGWGDYIYEYQCDNFDYESYDTYTSNYLDKIIEKLEDESQYADIHEYSELYNRLGSKYKLNSRYFTKNKRDFFYRGINPENNKILIQVFKKEGGLENRSYTEEEFNNFLVSPELFENKKNRKKY